MSVASRGETCLRQVQTCGAPGSAACRLLSPHRAEPSRAESDLSEGSVPGAPAGPGLDDLLKQSFRLKAHIIIIYSVLCTSCRHVSLLQRAKIKSFTLMRSFSPSGQEYNHWNRKEHSTVPWTTKLCTWIPNLLNFLTNPSDLKMFDSSLAMPCQIIHWAKFYHTRLHPNNGQMESWRTCSTTLSYLSVVVSWKSPQYCCPSNRCRQMNNVLDLAARSEQNPNW